MKNPQNRFLTGLIFLAVFVLSFQVVRLVIAWTGPQEYPPAGNPPQPLDVSDTGQHKAGYLTVGGYLRVGPGVGESIKINSYTRQIYFSSGGQSAQILFASGKFFIMNPYNSNSLVITSTSTGIGTANPKNELEVVGNIGLSFGAALKAEPHAGDNRQWANKKILETGHDDQRGDFVNIYTAGVADDNTNPKITILRGGNVGIGVTAPRARLHVQATRQQGATTTISGYFTDESVTSFLIGHVSSPFGDSAALGAFGGADAADDITFGRFNSQSLGFTELARIKGSSGNIGIGTTNPQKKLVVVGDIDVTGDYYKDGEIFEGGGGGGGGESLWIAGQENKIYYNAGNVGIGTTNPQAKLEIKSLTNNNGVDELPLRIQTFDNGYSLDIQPVAVAAGNYAYKFLTRAGINYSNPLTIDTRGNVGIGTTTPRQSLYVMGNIRIAGLTGQPDTSALLIGSGNSDEIPANWGESCYVSSIEFNNQQGNNPNLNNNQIQTIQRPDNCGSDNTTDQGQVKDRLNNPYNSCLDNQVGNFNDVAVNSYHGSPPGGGAEGHYYWWFKRTISCVSPDEPVYLMKNIGGTLTFQNNARQSVLTLGQDGALNVGPNRLIVAANGNVGIGTTNPLVSLAIGDTDTGLKWNSDGNLSIYTNNNARLTLLPNGNVGIGTTMPQYTLDVNGAVNSSASLVSGICQIGTTAGGGQLVIRGKTGQGNDNVLVLRRQVGNANEQSDKSAVFQVGQDGTLSILAGRTSLTFKDGSIALGDYGWYPDHKVDSIQICIDRYSAIKYRKDRNQSWVELGGISPNGEWNRGCGDNIPSTVKWDWSKTNGKAMEVCTYYSTEADCQIFNKNTADGTVISNHIIDDDEAGAHNYNIGYRLRNQVIAFLNYE